QIALGRQRVDIEADEGETIVGEEVGDLREGQAVLLHVEQKVATAAGAEKIDRGGDIRESCVREHLLPAAANARARRLKVAPSNVLARGDDAGARNLAVEADHHESAGPQHRHQHAPAGQRIGKVVEHATRFDEIKAAAE